MIHLFKFAINLNQTKKIQYFIKATKTTKELLFWTKKKQFFLFKHCLPLFTWFLSFCQLMLLMVLLMMMVFFVVFFYLQVLFFYKMLNFLMTLLSLSKGQPKSKIKTDKTFFSKRVANLKNEKNLEQLLLYFYIFFLLLLLFYICVIVITSKELLPRKCGSVLRPTF